MQVSGVFEEFKSQLYKIIYIDSLIRPDQETAPGL